MFFAGLTPFPYKVITIASGVTGLDLWTFGIASVFGRGMRFFAVAALLWWFGPPIKLFIERNLGWLTLAFFVLLFGGFLLGQAALSRAGPAGGRSGEGDRRAPARPLPWQAARSGAVAHLAR